jgi:glutamine synthetase
LTKASDALAQWPARLLTRDDLRRAVDAGEIDSVLVVAPDVQGKHFGKAMPADLFLAGEHVHLSSGPLTYDNDWTIPMAGFPELGPANGWADMLMAPDWDSVRPFAPVPRTALVYADGTWADGGVVEHLPRRVLQRQLERCAARGLAVMAAVETEFYVFAETFRSARAKRYVDLERVGGGGGAPDYSVQSLTLLAPFLGDLRRASVDSGIPIESVKHEWGAGQLELTFTYCDALDAADRAALFKLVAKQVAADHGLAATFMARHSMVEAGSSGHVHVSLWDAERGETAMADADDPARLGSTGRAFLGGLMALAPELMPLWCPNVNSYKRLDPLAFGPGTNSWSLDVRSTAFRIVGAGPSLRVESRIPGADANFHLALAGVVAAGLHGLETGAEPLGEPERDATRLAGGEPLPRNLAVAVERFRTSPAARAALGDAVVDHLVASADMELAVFDREVTDVERRRSFEWA